MSRQYTIKFPPSESANPIENDEAPEHMPRTTDFSGLVMPRPEHAGDQIWAIGMTVCPGTVVGFSCLDREHLGAALFDIHTHTTPEQIDAVKQAAEDNGEVVLEFDESMPAGNLTCITAQ